MAGAKNDRCVYYALNDSGRYLMYARESIRSLRRHNSAIPVRMLVYGSCPADMAAFLDEHGVTLTELPAARGKLTFVKWWALAHLTHERHLFADADTVFNDDVDLLFDRHGERDFYAREEGATAADSPEQDYEFDDPVEFLDLPFEVRSLRENGSGVDEPVLRRITGELGVERIPIFNTGVMLFNHGAHAAVAERLPQFASLSDDFGAGTLPYPASNPHLIDEVVASLVLSGIPGLSFGLLPMSDAPFYLELRANLCAGPGIVMHLFASYYWDYLKRCGTEAQRRELKTLVAASPLRRHRWKTWVATSRAMAARLVRLRRARAAERGGRYAEAAALARRAAETDMLFAYRGLRSVVHEHISSGAVRVLCRAVRGASEDAALDDREREARVAEYSAAAIRILGDLRKAGYFRVAGRLAELSSGAWLEPLRGRSEFGEFVALVSPGS